jgi:hypothetical protein
MTTPSRTRRRSSILLFLGLAAPLGLGACNAIFGIEPGLPAGTSGSSSTSTSTGSGPTCGADGGESATGTAIKLRVGASNGSDQVDALINDPGGNLVAAGFFDGMELTLGSSLTHTGTPGAQNGFVLKYSAAGAYTWGQAFGGSKSIRFNAAGTDAAGNIYATGNLAGTAMFGTTSLSAEVAGDPTSDNPDALVVSLDPAGAVRWARRFGNEDVQRGLRIAVDPAGATYLAGISYGQIDFGDGLIGDKASPWSFFVKLDGDGKLVWAQPISHWDDLLTPDKVEYFEIAIALDGKGQAIIGGNFTDPIFFGSDSVTPVGGADAFVASLDASTGAVKWHQTFHQPSGDPAPDGDQWITALTTDPCTGDVYAAGGFTQGIDFESQGGVKVSTGSPLEPDMFLVKLGASDGAPLWFHAYGDTGLQEATAVKVGPDGSVILGGFLLDAPNAVGVDFGAPVGFLQAAEVNPGPDFYSDAFLLKLDPTSGAPLWGKRLGDKYAQAAFDVAVDSTGKIALGGIVNGTLAIGGGQPPLMVDGFHAFLARFDP